MESMTETETHFHGGMQCDLCSKVLLLIEETEAEVTDKRLSQIRIFRNKFKRPPALLVIQSLGEGEGFRVLDVDTNRVQEYSREGMAWLVMSYRDAHNADCPYRELVPQRTFAEEVAENGGSVWKRK